MNKLQMTPQEIELGNLRGEVELLRYLLAQVVTGEQLATAADQARKALGASDGPNGQARIAFDDAHKRFVDLLK